MVDAPPEAWALVDPLLRAGGPAVRAVLLFGSQLVRASPDAHSAWDLVVVVDDYGSFHRHLVGAGHHRRPAWLLALLARVLPPSITAFDPGGGLPLAKCAIVSVPHFVRALGPEAPDHFLKGRMVQKVAIVWSRDEGIRATVEAALASARRGVLDWVGPHLDAEADFSPDQLARRMLEVSYGGEVRPERGDRVEQVFRAQRDFLVEVFGRVLEREAAEGRVVPTDEGRYRLTDPPGRARSRAVSRYFWRSKVRATLRWAKHVLTFNDWLTYIERKVERRTGMEIEIGPWERRLPLLLLWPKVIRVLRNRNDPGPRAPLHDPEDAP
jgi:hypothetical protein